MEGDKEMSKVSYYKLRTLELGLRQRLRKLDLEGYRAYLYGSLARSLWARDTFRPDSDIDVLLIPSLGKPVITYDKRKEIEKRLGEEIDEHKIHVFSQPSALEYKDRILLKEWKVIR